MSAAQTKYLKATLPEKYSLKEWAALGKSSTTAQAMDALWTSKVLGALETSTKQSEQEAFSRLSKLTKGARMKQFESVVVDRNFCSVIRLVPRVKVVVEREQTDDNEAACSSKRRLSAPSRPEARKRIEPLKSSSIRSTSSLIDILPSESDSDRESREGDISPSELRLARRVGKSGLVGSSSMAALGQEVSWCVDGIDLVKKFQEFRRANMGPYSLALDGIADLTQESAFYKSLDKDTQVVARRVSDRPDIYKRWPTLQPILDRVLQSNRYGDIAKAVQSEDMKDPVAAYLFTVVMAYYHYFAFRSEVPENVSEGEGFAGLTWAFLQTPLTMCDVESRYLEVLIKGVEERKNQGKDVLLDHKDYERQADAVGLHDNQQLLLVEASQLHHPDMQNRRQDEWKLTRAMRDSWISQVRMISNLAIPHRGLAVFGCASFKDETKLLRMDYHGAFRLQQFDYFIIPLRAENFGVKMRSAVVSCLELAASIREEITRRNKTKNVLSYDQRATLRDAALQIEKTTSAPANTKARRL